MKVIFLPEILEYFEDLMVILYEKEYFGYKDSARNYVTELINEIKENLPNRLHKPASKYFDKYGKNMEYAGFRKNKNTIWYAFFTSYKVNRETIYLVRHIANNHTISQHL